MKRIGILPNIDKDENLEVTKRLVHFLAERGCQPCIPSWAAEKAGLDQYGKKEEDIYKDRDFLVSLGGDGTLLGVGRKAAYYNTPILGINLGTLGYLTAEEKTKAEVAVDRVLQGHYKLEKRIMANMSITSQPERIEDMLALNDVCITRGISSKILEFNLFINNEYVDTMRADGVVICTPTGSTAYNLSAGGPIIKGDAKIMAITPICPHSLRSRSIIISANDKVTVEVCTRDDEEFTVSADGQLVLSLRRENVVQISKAEQYTTIIKTNDLGFYDVLRQKLAR